jgi:hypothetical protein
VPGYVGINVTGNGFSIGNGGTNPGYFNSTSFQIADDSDLVRGNHQFSIGGNWIHSKIETLNNRPTTARSPSTARARASHSPTSCSASSAAASFRATRLRLRQSEYIGAYAQDNWRVRPN